MASCFNLVIISAIVAVSQFSSSSAIAGGWSDERVGTDDNSIQEVLLSVKTDFLTKSRLGQVNMFICVSYKQQVVAGMNYLMKVKLDTGAFTHLKVHKPLPHTSNPPELKGYQLEKKLSDELEPFPDAFPIAKSALGSTQDTEPADQTIQNLVDGIKGQFVSKFGFDQRTFEAISFRKQIVAGTNYFVKVRIDDYKYVHLRIYQPLPGQGSPSLTGYQLEKKLTDSLDHFSPNVPVQTSGNASSFNFNNAIALLVLSAAFLLF